MNYQLLFGQSCQDLRRVSDEAVKVSIIPCHLPSGEGRNRLTNVIDVYNIITLHTDQLSGSPSMRQTYLVICIKKSAPYALICIDTAEEERLCFISMRS